MAISYTANMLIERVRRHMADGWPSDEFSISENEMLLYIDAAKASTAVASIMGIAKVTGQMSTPDSYIINTQLPALVKNEPTGEWFTTLPQTPLSLSLGYSITNAFLSDATNGISQPIWLVKSKRSAYRDYMPKPNGTLAKVKGNKIYVKANDGSSLSGLAVYVDMITTRTTDRNEVMNMPDDAIEGVFQKVVAQCKDRMGIPRDIIKDGIGQGATNVSR